MKKLMLTLVLSLIPVAPAFAQTGTPHVEVFGGFSYLNADTNGLSKRRNLEGWETSASVDLMKYVAVEGDVTGYYENHILGGPINGRDYGFAGGPRFKYRQFFVHSLFGADHLTGTEPIAISGASVSFSQTDFMFIQGGGVQLKIAPHVAVRTSADWVLTRHNISGGNTVDQNNFRVGVGLVFTFGGGR